VVSMAALQGHLLTHKSSAERAIESLREEIIIMTKKPPTSQSEGTVSIISPTVPPSQVNFVS